jgi:hypothetical protein
MAIVVTLLTATRGFGASLDRQEPWRIPFDPNAAASASDEFAWRLFVALNWPATVGSQSPAARLGRAVARPAAWERWQNSADVYRDDGADPGPWRALAEPSVAVEHRFESLADEGFPELRHIVGGRMVSLDARLPNARRLVEIRMNRLAFDYIRAAQLYNLDGQIHQVANREGIEFPLGAIEVKASWRPIRRADRSRYHTLRVRFADGVTRLYGLSALNIAAKESPQWFWASFEHVDNATRVADEGWRPTPAAIALQAGAWKNYRLRGTMTRYVDDAGAPQRLGNSELEAGFEATASCMTCHARSALAVDRGAPRRLEIFDTRETPGRRGYVGVPDPGWFHASAAADHGDLDFQPLDFVWSLARAKPRRDSPAGVAGERRRVARGRR